MYNLGSSSRRSVEPPEVHADESETKSNDTSNNNVEVIFRGQSANNNFSAASRGAGSSNRFSNAYSSSKTLQRKLELKVERAKKNYSLHGGGVSANDLTQDSKMNNVNLIPINRLSIPGRKEELPLVDYKSEHSDDDECTSPFFPAKSRPSKIVDLSDTFSIQEMNIMSDDSGDESGDSQNLELLPPSVRIKFIDKLVNYFCCSSADPLFKDKCVVDKRI